MKYLLIVFLLIGSTSIAQIQTTIDYRYYYNSDVTFTDKQYNQIAQEYQSVETIASATNNSLLGISLFIPFNVFDKESLLYSNKFSLDLEAYFQFDHNIGSKLIQQYYRIAFDYKPTNHPIYINTTLTSASPINGYQSTVINGYDYKIGVNYNITNQQEDKLMNFYAGVNYIIYGEYNTLEPYGNIFNSTHDFETIIGFVLNIKNFFYVEQRIRTISDFNLPETFSFTPYYSDYSTKLWIRFNKIDIIYQHTCFHPIVSDNENPKIGGVLNHVGLEFNF